MDTLGAIICLKFIGNCWLYYPLPLRHSNEYRFSYTNHAFNWMYLMTPQQQAVGVTILFSAIGVLADYYLKIASGKAFPWNSWQFLLGLSLYASTAFGWLFVMQHLKLAAVGILYTSSMLVMLAIVGYFGFGEKLSIKEWIGFALALASVLLLVRDH